MTSVHLTAAGNYRLHIGLLVRHLFEDTVDHVLEDRRPGDWNAETLGSGAAIRSHSTSAVKRDEELALRRPQTVWRDQTPR